MKTLQAGFLITIVVVASTIFIATTPVQAGSCEGLDLAAAILANYSTLVSSSYQDVDNIGCRQSIVLSSLGVMLPTHGATFALLSTGIAGANPVTENQYNPGSERGGWFAAGKYIDPGEPADQATLTLNLQVPAFMHYFYYDVQFFSAEYPEYVGTIYNDKFTTTVVSPSKGTTQYVIDVNSGDFILTSNHIPGTGYDIFATSGDSSGVDWVSTTPRTPGADAGATALIRREHPVSPFEIITVKFDIRDV